MDDELYHVPVERLRWRYWPEQMKPATVGWHARYFRERCHVWKPIYVTAYADGTFGFLDGRHIIVFRLLVVREKTRQIVLQSPHLRLDSPKNFL